LSGKADDLKQFIETEDERLINYKKRIKNLREYMSSESIDMQS